MDSDVPCEHNSPGTPSFVWTERENFVRCHCLEGNPGVHAQLDEFSSPLEIITSFFTEELLQKIVDETNR